MDEKQVAQFRRNLIEADWRPVKSRNHPAEPTQSLARACAPIVEQSGAMWFYDFFNPLLGHMRDLYQQRAIYGSSHFRKYRGSRECILDSLKREIGNVEESYGKPLMQITEADFDKNRSYLSSKIRSFQKILGDGALEQVAEQQVADNVEEFLTDKTRLLLTRLRRDDSYRPFAVQTVQELMRSELAGGKMDGLNFLVTGEQVNIDFGELREALKLQQRLSHSFSRDHYASDEGVEKQLQAGRLDARVYSSLVRYMPVAHTSSAKAVDFLGRHLNLNSEEGRNVFLDIMPKART